MICQPQTLRRDDEYRAKGRGRYATLAIEVPVASQAWHIKLRPGKYGNLQFDEAARTRWAKDRLPAPSRVCSIKLPGISALITKTLEGAPSHERIDVLRPIDIIAGIIEALKTIHATDVSEFPFDAPYWVTEEGISNNIKHLKQSKTKHRELHPDFSSRTYAELKDIIDRGATVQDKRLVHGDFCMPNVLLGTDASLAGIVDLGALHVGNAEHDLAIMSWTVEANMGHGWAAYLLGKSGVAASSQDIVYSRLIYDLGLERPDPWAWMKVPQLVEQRERLSHEGDGND